jgi:hypothetical protein
LTAGRNRPTRPLVGLLLLVSAIASPVAADETGTTRVRLTTDRLDLLFALDGASPVAWRACHPSCALVEGASGSSVRFTGADDPPQARLSLRGPGPAPDLQRLRFTAAVTEDARARRVTFQSDLPGGRIRLVKAFEVSKDEYEVVMTVRLMGADAAAFMTDRRLEVSLGAGAVISSRPRPPASPRCSSVCSGSSSPTAASASSATTAETPCRFGPAAGLGFAAGSGRYFCVRTGPPPSRRAPRRASP